MKAIIMAGGKGRRLAPYTTVFPKALMPLGDTPILGIIIRQLQSYRFEKIFVAMGYLSELITSYFNQKNNLGTNVVFLKEKRPLGTFGAVANIRGMGEEPFFVINGDVLTTLDYKKLYDFHSDNKAALTVAIHKRVMDIDFGVVEISKEKQVLNHSEKPKVELLVGMGIYVVSPAVLKYLKKNQKIDFPQILRRLLADRKKVSAYISNDYWMDIGRPEDYERAVNDYLTCPDSFVARLSRKKR